MHCIHTGPAYKTQNHLTVVTDNIILFPRLCTIQWEIYKGFNFGMLYKISENVNQKTTVLGLKFGSKNHLVNQVFNIINAKKI